jgi:fatty-acyl-CoA synthase
MAGWSSVRSPNRAPQPPLRTMGDVRALEKVPLNQAITANSTYEIFQRSAFSFGDKTALTFLPTGDLNTTPVRWSYAELLSGIHRTANALHALGLTATDTVAVLLPGCLQYHLALWGGEAAGIVQPLNPLLSDDKLASLLSATGAKILVVWGEEGEATYWSKALRLRDRVASLKTVLSVGGERANAGEGIFDFASALAVQPGDRLLSGRQISPSDTAAYFHTGGTTGAPKLAIHSHAAQVFTAWACVQMQGALPSDVVINGYPLFHVAGVLPGSLAALSAGVETIIPTPTLMRNKEVIANYWRIVEKYRCTVVSAVPTVLAALSNVALEGADISSVRYCRTGAAALPAELSARYKRLFGLHVHESFGMTEMAGISTITPPGLSGPAGCVGFRVPYSQMRIVKIDSSGNASEEDVAADEVGIVLFKAPNLFGGFLTEQDTRAAFTADGWLITGDLGWVDDQERLNLTGRSKDLIIRGGHNIDPRVIEDALGAHPAVQMCAAVGLLDGYAGELPVVFATLVPGKSATEQELLEFTFKGVDEPAAKPKFLKILEALPMTNVGKIYKPDLRELAQSLWTTPQNLSSPKI